MGKRCLGLIATLALLAAGCGGTGRNPARQGRDSGGRILVAALGDSITAGSPQWDPDPGVREAHIGTGADPRSQYEYWARRQDPRLRFRNCGVFGERTDQIAARLASCADGADALVIQGGINDIAQGRPVADAAASLRRMVREGKRRDLPVALTDVLPWNNGHPAADPLIRRLNSLIDAIGRQEGAPVLPFHDTLADPKHPGLMKGRWTYEGDHPSIAGYRRLGELAFRLP